VEQREGHAFVGNLLVADERFTKALLRFEQPPALKARLTRPQVARLNDNLYVRRATDVAKMPTLIVWSPSPTAESRSNLDSPAAVTMLHAQFENRSRYLNRDFNTVVRSVELHRFEPSFELRFEPAEPLSPETMKATGWKDVQRPPGAYANAR
jgi:hypothetical protein